MPCPCARIPGSAIATLHLFADVAQIVSALNHCPL